jgi:diadenosine tetraphosphatase ApaH/serine/threonine PP2A family protein phosphatase
MTDDGIASASPEPGDSIGLADHRMLLNPGSVGQPRDGDPRASYLVLDRETGQASWHRVAYDVPSVQAAIRAAGLPARLADRLSRGL